ncbi:MAG: hypothetical protein AVDCRST_MAG68-3375 [uncultured Gemmatimonadetes bacterium]|uniref:Uncharacterized protein n=1 Tax=uncultured Gemmatimonadota bacterium TaxID=203437 RepID=A0A6J4LKS5_9BACT|nr:MAG: hypothetical protein AVDCRST_MAG68-3375 [uncultured Gemmatimonadota bacterium]
MTLEDPNLVRFVRDSPGENDDFTLEVSSECGPTERFPYRPETADAAAFVSTTLNARFVGSCTVTFALQNYRAGRVVIDDVEVDRLLGTARLDQEAVQRIERVLRRQQYQTSFSTAQTRVTDNAKALGDATRGLGVRVSRTYALQAIQSLGSAMALRTAINNPLEYPELSRVVTQMGNISKPVEVHTNSLKETVNGVFGVVKSALQGDLFDAASKLVSTASTLRGFRDSVRDMLALTSTDEAGQRRMATALGMHRDTAAKGIAGVYTGTVSFLNRVISDAEHVDGAARASAQLAVLTGRSAAQGDSLIVEVLRFAGKEGTARELRAFKEAAVRRAENAGSAAFLDTLQSAIDAKVSAVETAPAAERTKAMNELAARMEVYLRGAQQLVAGFEPLVIEQADFFRSEITYLCGLEPVPGTKAMRDLWIEKAKGAVAALEGAETAFYEAYKFTAPRARECRLKSYS